MRRHSAWRPGDGGQTNHSIPSKTTCAALTPGHFLSDLRFLLNANSVGGLRGPGFRMQARPCTKKQWLTQQHKNRFQIQNLPEVLTNLKFEKEHISPQPPEGGRPVPCVPATCPSRRPRHRGLSCPQALPPVPTPQPAGFPL